MIIDGIDFNVEYAKSTPEKDWINRHLSICSNVAESDRETYLQKVYGKLTDEKKPSKSESKPKSE